MLDFDSSRQATAPRPAATVIVLRPAPAREDGAPGGVEVFCVLRHQKSSFLGGAIVFPGGKVDAGDAAADWGSLATEPHARAAVMETADASARALAVAACRESLEEAAILPIDQALGDAEVLAMRAELEGGGSLADALRRRGARLALDALVPWARWVTPEAESRRFDARFFLLLAPRGQSGAHDNHETTQSFWASPADVLRRFVANELFLAPPTCRTLELLAACATVDDALALAAEQSLLPICPRFVAHDTAPFLALPGDPAHELKEKRVEGKTRFVLRDGKFLGEDPS